MEGKIIGEARQKGWIGTWVLWLTPNSIKWDTGLVLCEIPRSRISSLAIGIPSMQEFEADLEKGLAIVGRSESAHLYIGFRRDARRRTSRILPVFPKNREWLELVSLFAREHKDAYKGTGPLRLAMEIVEGASSSWMPMVGVVLGFLMALLVLYFLAG